MHIHTRRLDNLYRGTDEPRVARCGPLPIFSFLYMHGIYYNNNNNERKNKTCIVQIHK